MAKTQNSQKPKQQQQHQGTNTRKSSKHGKPHGKPNNRQQPKKDSNSPRVNYDNAREDKVANQIKKDAASGKFNDINDFLRNPMLIKAAGSYPVFPILGTNVSSELPPVSGLLTIYWYPNFGCYRIGAPEPIQGETNISLTPPPVALNQAMDSTYSFVVHANSRNYSYNAPDLFLLILAGAQVFAILEAMKRAYGYAKQYVETSLYQPNTVLRDMGFDPISMRQNLGQAWYDLNNLITQSRQIWVPNAYPIVTRWMDLNSNLYKDAEGPYAQTYMFVQNMFYMYDETTYATGGALRPAWVSSGGADSTFKPGEQVYSWSQWVQVAQRMIDALVNSEDRGIIYGDLLNAYTAERIIAIPELDSSYTIEREYSPEISMQIENLTIIHDRYVPNLLIQVGNDLYPTYTGRHTTSQPSFFAPPKNPVMNFHVTSDPTPEMILLATRYVSAGVHAVSLPGFNDSKALMAYNDWIVDIAGSEIVTKVRMANRPQNVRQDVTDWNQSVFDPTALVPADMGNLMTFDWHPFLYSAVIPTSGTTQYPPAVTTALVKASSQFFTEVSHAYGDYDRYTVAEPELLRKLNDAAEYSLFGVPQL